jgi:hypothetical protein
MKKKVVFGLLFLVLFSCQVIALQVTDPLVLNLTTEENTVIFSDSYDFVYNLENQSVPNFTLPCESELISANISVSGKPLEYVNWIYDVSTEKDLIVDNETVQLYGNLEYDEVYIINNGSIDVLPLDPVVEGSGYLNITANYIFVNSSESLVLTHKGFEGGKGAKHTNNNRIGGNGENGKYNTNPMNRHPTYYHAYYQPMGWGGCGGSTTSKGGIGGGDLNEACFPADPVSRSSILDQIMASFSVSGAGGGGSGATLYASFSGLDGERGSGYAIFTARKIEFHSTVNATGGRGGDGANVTRGVGAFWAGSSGAGGEGGQIMFVADELDISNSVFDIRGGEAGDYGCTELGGSCGHSGEIGTDGFLKFFYISSFKNENVTVNLNDNFEDSVYSNAFGIFPNNLSVVLKDGENVTEVWSYGGRFNGAETLDIFDNISDYLDISSTNYLCSVPIGFDVDNEGIVIVNATVEYSLDLNDYLLVSNVTNGTEVGVSDNTRTISTTGVVFPKNISLDGFYISGNSCKVDGEYYTVSSTEINTTNICEYPITLD